MFLQKIKKRGVEYLYLMESKYDKNKKIPVKSTIQSFGRYDVFAREHPDELKILEEEYGNKWARLEKDRNTKIDSFLEKNKFDIKLNSEEISILTQKTSHLFLKKIWEDDLLLSRHLKYLQTQDGANFNFNPSWIALYYMTLKIIGPTSYLEGINISSRFLGDPMGNISEDSVYRCLRYLSEKKDEIIKHVNKRIDKINPRNHSLLFYDCTNCYFETSCSDEYWNRRKALRTIKKILIKDYPEICENIDEKKLNDLIFSNNALSDLFDCIIKSYGDPLRMYGLSKEKRTDLPIISIALVMDENAIPIDFNVFPGNISEGKTLYKSINCLKKKYNIDNAVFVADSALNSIKNLTMLGSNGLGFAVAKSALTFSNEIRNKQLNIDDFINIVDESGNKTNILYKVIPFKKTVYTKDDVGKRIKNTLNCNLMITFSEKRRERDLALLEILIERAKQAIERSEDISVAKSGWKQLIDTEEAKEANSDSSKNKKKKFYAKALKEEIIEKRKKCAGFAGILFKSPPDKDDLTPARVSSLYHHLVQIEECFRIMKNDLELRPMFVRQPDSITGHILICFLALVVIRIIQKKLSSINISITSSEIGKIFANFSVSYIISGDREYYLSNNEYPLYHSKNKDEETYFVKYQEIMESLLKCLGFTPLKGVYNLSDLRKYFHIKTLNQSEYQKKYVDFSRLTCPPIKG